MRNDFEKRKIQVVKPTSDTWNAIIEAYARSRWTDSTHHATRVLADMSEFSQTYTDVQPDKMTISSMMNALVRNAKNDKNAGKQAVRILDQTLASYHNGNLHMKPDKMTISSMMNA
eukprot:CAMPEP_0204617820 /NCGR_PEP_ID=MMETSP0717-20131115/4686_1 /ASSEMBLY_ACC=CAM_ASM_000666 /TAXON_ID=230516 /ORGANISM="Chaetoceros curvisetus" /LENGTH=115 /DNA_ID=CAMNT_0051631451 /DNA_START=152 /DNA_END=496 /DNA_ORIENTATION=-